MLEDEKARWRLLCPPLRRGQKPGRRPLELHKGRQCIRGRPPCSLLLQLRPSLTLPLQSLVEKLPSTGPASQSSFQRHQSCSNLEKPALRYTKPAFAGDGLLHVPQGLYMIRPRSTTSGGAQDADGLEMLVLHVCSDGVKAMARAYGGDSSNECD